MQSSNSRYSILSVSVLIPTLQRDSLKGTIESLEKQSLVIDEILVLSEKGAIPSLLREAAKRAKTDFVAVVDDDAIFDESWLMNAKKYFDDAKVAYVCGTMKPLPDEGNQSSKRIAKVQTSFLGSFKMASRYRAGEISSQEMDETGMTGMGLFRRIPFVDALTDLGDTPTAGWENSVMTWLIKHDYKTFYARECSFHHKPRDSLKLFAKQSFKNATGRTFYFRNYPSEFPKKSYFILPTVFVISLLFWPWNVLIMTAYVAGILVETHDVRLLPYFLANHIGYGLGFLYGFTQKRHVNRRAKPKL
jgi:glycosyltransferase involved in cell wall biosynthesis